MERVKSHNLLLRNRLEILKKQIIKASSCVDLHAFETSLFLDKSLKILEQIGEVSN